MPSASTIFVPLRQEEELAILRGDISTFDATVRYLTPLIDSALLRVGISGRAATKLRGDLRRDVPVAATRYLAKVDARKSSYKFSTYFTWYIRKRLESQNA